MAVLRAKPPQATKGPSRNLVTLTERRRRSIRALIDLPPDGFHARCLRDLQRRTDAMATTKVGKEILEADCVSTGWFVLNA